MTPLVSIIVPVYNIAPYLRKALDSVVVAVGRLERSEVAKKLPSTQAEVICVDDGSTDNSGKILDDFAREEQSLPPNLSVRVIHQENAGVSAARNVALDLASGVWVMMLDGDDVWEADLLERLFARVVAHEDCDIVCFRCVCVDEAGEIVRRHPRNCCETFVTGSEILGESRGLYSSFVWGCWDKVIRREFLNRTNVRFVCGMRRQEDTLFAQTLLALTDHVLLLPEIEGYRYLMREGSAVHIKDSTLPEEPWRIFLVLHEIWRRNKTLGLKKRLQHIAAAAPTLACQDGYEPKVRKEAIEFLLDDKVFNGKILPFMFCHGSWKARVFAGMYLLLPKKIRRQVLKRMGGVSG